MSSWDPIEPLIHDFERACHSSSNQTLTEFLNDRRLNSRVPLSSLFELICIDMEFNWRRWHTKRSVVPLRLEDYLQQYPALGSADKVSLDLIVEEYRTRQCFGDRPTHGEYFDRFAKRRELIGPLLKAVDRELQVERDVTTATTGGSKPRRALHQPDPRAPLTSVDFLLEHLIGSGRTGKVYRALQRSLNRHVAVKHLRKSLMEQPESIERFITEARIVAQLRHPGIVAIHGLGKTPVAYFMAMELIDGADLAHVVHTRPVSVHEAINWTMQACEAMQHAHERGIVHCDLKPSNLLLDQSGCIHVTDFGLARTLPDRTSGEARLEGTAPFMAPEQVSDFWGSIGPRTDVYGLGAVLHSLLVGEATWCGQRLSDVLAQVVSAQPARSVRERRADISAELASICDRCLAKNPEERFESVQSLHSALLGII